MRLKACDVTFGYSKKQNVLSGVNFCIEQGEVAGLTAPSGYGKSTLAKLLAGFERPKQGKIVLEDNAGRIVTSPKGEQNPVQLIFQHPEKAVNPRWKMRKVLEEAGMPEDELRKAAGIQEGWLDRWPTELSGGELQRFCVVRALKEGTRFLIADEMTTMLDAVTQAQIWNLVLLYAKEHDIGVIVISHDMELLKRVCGRVVDLAEQNIQ